MNGRPGHEPLKFLPDEARSLPPPKLNDPRLVYMGLLGYCTGLMDNMLRMRPVMRAGEGCGRSRSDEELQGCPLRSSVLYEAFLPSWGRLALPGRASPLGFSAPRVATLKKTKCSAMGTSKPHG